MSELKRIDPAAVPGMFVRLGVRPVRGRWAMEATSREVESYEGVREGECLACLMGIVASDVTSFAVTAKAFGARNLAEWTGLARSYAMGLSDGWEDRRPYAFCQVANGDDPEYLIGFDDGAAAYRACLDAGLTVAEERR